VEREQATTLKRLQEALSNQQQQQVAVITPLQIKKNQKKIYIGLRDSGLTIKILGIH
jgi:diphthamide synthase subunit DPH2